MKNIMHEINIEGKTDYKTFMSEVNNQLAHSGYDF